MSGTPGAPSLLVVAGILVRDGRLLLARRPLGSAYAGLWELPGGKVEAGETPEAALAREWREELGVRIAGPRPFTFVSSADAARHLTILFFEIGALAGEPKPVGTPAVRWSAAQEARLLGMPPADEIVRDRLLAAGGGRFRDTEGADRHSLIREAEERDPYIFGSESLRPGQVLCFRKTGLPGRPLVDGLLLKTQEGAHAYENLCPHVPIRLDRGEGILLDEEDRLVCRSHGAVFDPESGLCLSGPCHGERLSRLPIEGDGDGFRIG